MNDGDREVEIYKKRDRGIYRKIERQREIKVQ